MRYWWNKGLTKEMRNNLKNRLYSYEDMETIFNTVSHLYHERLKTFKRLIIFILIVLLIGLLLNLIYIEDKFIAVASVLFLLLFFVFVMIFVYFKWVVKERNQFKKCTKTSYPELVEKFVFD